MNFLDVAGVAVSPDHYIGGARVASAETFELFSPIDQRMLGRISEGTAEHTDAAISCGPAGFSGLERNDCRRAQALPRPLCRRDRQTRRGFLPARKQRRRRAAVAHAPRRGATRDAQHHWFAEHALQLQDHAIDTEQAHHIVRHDPAGVVVIITPWNAPLMLSTWKLGPALAAGNTCILKPPEWAPLTCSLLADAADAAGLPPGVFNVVQGTGASTGARLVGDPRIARISFTGSVPTARIIAQAAGANLVPCSLELGGKSPFIVLEDADYRCSRSDRRADVPQCGPGLSGGYPLPGA